MDERDGNEGARGAEGRGGGRLFIKAFRAPPGMRSGDWGHSSGGRGGRIEITAKSGEPREEEEEESHDGNGP